MTADDANSLRHPWLAVALLVLVAAVCTGLGAWQLGRAEQSRAVQQRLAAAGDLEPLAAAVEPDSERELAELRFRSLELEGRYAPERQVLIDNIVHGGVAGYYVLTPFEPSGGGRWLIVNRGWVAADPARRVLPDVAVDDAERVVAGRIDTLPSPGLRLGEGAAQDTDAALLVLSYPTMTELERHLGRPLLGYQLLLAADGPDGFARDWPAPGLEPVRHLAYAGQWWLFAAVAVVIASILAWRHVRRRSG